MKSLPAFILCLALLASAGCHSSPGSRITAEPSPQPTESSTGHHGRISSGATAGVFDYYVFNLSWSPEFCDTHPDSHECASRPGFVVHGLWPQNNDGTYPENCGNGATPNNPAAYLNLIPTVAMIEHEWQTHGVCSGLNPDDYFSDVRTAFQSVEIPATFARSSLPPARVDPEVILNQFRQDNPSFPRSSFVLTCGHNQLTAIEVCFNRKLEPQPCQGLHSCRARSITITPP